MTTVRSALIIGASRGLGLGLVQRLREDGWAVTATVRDPGRATVLKAIPGIRIETLEMGDVASMDALRQRVQGEVFDLLYVNAGIMGPRGEDTDAASATDIGQLFTINAVAPIRLARRLAGQIRAEGGVIAFMSSILGSITMPDAPDLTLYKASKAALNSMTHTFVTQLENPRITVLSLHPGWVKTDMGGEQANLDVATSTRGLVEQVYAFAGKGGHHFIDYKGETLAW